MKIADADLDYQIIGQRIKEARKKIGISQEKLAERVDVTTAYMSRIERGTSKINLKKLVQIAQTLDTPIEKLITGTETNSKIYLQQEFQELLEQCSTEKQRLIYNIAKIISGIKFV